MNEEFKEKYEKLTDEQKKEFDLLDEDKQQEYLDNIPEKLFTEDTDEVLTEETKEPEVELKSLLVNLKSELTKVIENKNKELDEKIQAELKSLKDKLEKIENQPVIKSMKSDPSKMLGYDDNLKIKDISALDLI